MLNDLVAWATNRWEQLKLSAADVVREITTTNVMEWSTTAWVWIVGCVIAIMVSLRNV